MIRSLRLAIPTLPALLAWASLSAASTFSYLEAPPGVLTNGQSTCVANVVNANGTVSSACQSVTRFSRPWTADIYVATWSVSGAVDPDFNDDMPF